MVSLETIPDDKSYVILMSLINIFCLIKFMTYFSANIIAEYL